MKTQATSLDVARLAGVSQSAVSRCFTAGASVSEAMRNKVQEAARKLGYQPNAHARSLITGRSRILAWCSQPWKTCITRRCWSGWPSACSKTATTC